MPDESLPSSSDSDSLAEIVEHGNVMSVFNEIFSLMPVLVSVLLGFIAFRKVFNWFGGVIKGM